MGDPTTQISYFFLFLYKFKYIVYRKSVPCILHIGDIYFKYCTLASLATLLLFARARFGRTSCKEQGCSLRALRSAAVWWNATRAWPLKNSLYKHEPTHLSGPLRVGRIPPVPHHVPLGLAVDTTFVTPTLSFWRSRHGHGCRAWSLLMKLSRPTRRDVVGLETCWSCVQTVRRTKNCCRNTCRITGKRRRGPIHAAPGREQVLSAALYSMNFLAL